MRRDSWTDFIVEGAALFDYMIQNFDSMFEGESIIKHFNIRDEGIYDICSDEIMQKYGSAIEKELIPWIHDQFSQGQLFEKENWKPFRDRCSLSEAYLGYSQMFHYRDYYFYLVINQDYIEYEPRKCKRIVHFQLVLLYGLKDERVKPDDRVVILSNNTVPVFYWDRK